MTFIKTLSSSGQRNYLLCINSGQTTNLSVDGRCEFDTVLTSLGTNISLNTGNGVFTLKAGNTYKLLAEVTINFASSTTSTNLEYGWYDITNGQYHGNKGIARPIDGNSNNTSMGESYAIITPSSNINVELRWSFRDGSITDLETRTHAAIEQI